MNRSLFGVPALADPDRVKADTELVARFRQGHSPMHSKKRKEASVNLSSHRVGAGLGKAALKTHALQTLTRGPLTRRNAKRLECARFISAFLPSRAMVSGSGLLIEDWTLKIADPPPEQSTIFP